jgi:hypothetical protein
VDRLQCEQEAAALREKESDAIGIVVGEAAQGVAQTRSDVSFEALWSFNQHRIDAYHAIATSQSKISFLSSQVVTFFGFALIVAVGIIATRAATDHEDDG